MNELINVTLNDSHEPVVSGRQLHEALGVKTEYKKWFSRMTEYGFNEDEDFLKVTQKCLTSSTGQNTTDHIIKLDMAKEIGANRLFSWMRENGYLIKRKGSDWNMPTQRSMDLKLFEIKETNVQHADGHISVNKTPKVTGKGQQYFINKFLNQEYLIG